MDVEKFNKQLKSKVSLAKNYEKKNDLESAIKIWFEVSEMTLNFSKSRNIDSAFKNMLITRTKGIIAHIKNLKSGQIEKSEFEEDIFIEEDVQDNFTSEFDEKETTQPQKLDLEGIKEIQDEPQGDIQINEESEFNKIPKGFKEIQPKKFKIITPHDENYLEKHLSQVHNSDSEGKQERFEFEEEDKNTLTCFACGYDKNPKNAKTCKSCGTELN
ncbi:MAG: hypothetical protein ACFFA3_09585 [Promethearchaeota archaeon]